MRSSNDSTVAAARLLYVWPSWLLQQQWTSVQPRPMLLRHLDIFWLGMKDRVTFCQWWCPDSWWIVLSDRFHEVQVVLADANDQRRQWCTTWCCGFRNAAWHIRPFCSAWWTPRFIPKSLWSKLNLQKQQIESNLQSQAVKSNLLVPESNHNVSQIAI